MKPTRPISLLTHSIQENGYHPTSTTIITLTEPELLVNCSLHLHFTLPPLIFVDPYELAHREASYTFRHWGPADLERPVTAVQQESSHLLLNVARHADTEREHEREVEVQLPLHLRYGDVSKSPYHVEHVPWPSAASISSSGPPTLPNDETLFLFPADSKFVQIAHYGAGAPDRVRVPTGAPSDLAFVELSTLGAIFLTFCFLVRTSQVAYRRINRPLEDKKS
ncbi:hypothetical protein H0H92_000978 [Tricholoma furcatifolium]|nr:hypothetical protein H0H92_000978 [Tricholoma furcatifolium]